MASFNKHRKAATQARGVQFLQTAFPSRLHLEAAVCALRIIEQFGWYARILKGTRFPPSGYPTAPARSMRPTCADST